MTGRGNLRGAGTALVLFVVFLFASLTATAHAARVCGDDVNGSRVPCACGDVVASDTRLRVGDPVVSGRCESDGLIVKAPATAESIRLDLAGLALVGSGIGYGVRVDRGGSDGATITGGAGRAEIVGFDIGIMSPNAAGLARLENVKAKGNARDGIRVRQHGAFLVNVHAEGNGEDGIWIFGKGGRVIGAVAERNGGSGMRLTSPGMIVDGKAYDNAEHGVVSGGRGSDLSAVESRNNGRNGLVVKGGRQNVVGAFVEGNMRRELATPLSRFVE